MDASLLEVLAFACLFIRGIAIRPLNAMQPDFDSGRTQARAAELALMQLGKSEVMAASKKASPLADHPEEETASQLEGQRKRAVVALYGAQNRDLGCAAPSQQHNIFEVLKGMGYDLDIFVLEIIGFDQMDNAPFVPGTKAHMATFYRNVTVDDVDRAIAAFCATVTCKYRPDYDNYEGMVQRALRQLWLENEVASFLRNSKDNYEMAVSSESSIWLPAPISSRDVERMVSSQQLVMRSANNDAGGYTNGFYAGKPSDLAKVMDRFHSSYFPEQDDYEHQLRRAFESASINSEVLDGHAEQYNALAKLRHNGAHWWHEVVLDEPTQACLKLARASTGPASSFVAFPSDSDFSF